MPLFLCLASPSPSTPNLWFLCHGLSKDILSTIPYPFSRGSKIMPLMGHVTCSLMLCPRERCCDWDYSYLSLLHRWECGSSGKWVACPKSCKHKWWSRNLNPLKFDTKVKALLLCYFPPRFLPEDPTLPLSKCTQELPTQHIQAGPFTIPKHSSPDWCNPAPSS